MIPMYTALICEEQAKVNNIELREKGLALPNYSIEYIQYDLFYYEDNKQDLNSSIFETSAGTDKEKTHYQEHHDMAWSYTRC
jgi:hypothetical protein